MLWKRQSREVQGRIIAAGCVRPDRGLCLGVSQPLCSFDTQGEDIYYAYIEGQRLVAGENPYERILQGGMLTNDKYATYLPLFYLFFARLQMAGWRSYTMVLTRARLDAMIEM
ncbi:MAG: hypothetical protein ACP5G7_03360 [Anaerolineae bacterium]